MTWTTARELKERVLLLWQRGRLGRDVLGCGEGFPLRLPLRGPDSGDVAERFEAVRAWAAELASQRHVRLEWREVRHRVQGRQSLPAAVWVDSLEDALALAGRRQEAEMLRRLAADLRSQVPALFPWLAQNPTRALLLAGDWSRLLAVVTWMMEHPRPGVYLRQVDLPGVDSKFIEAHRGVLREWFDAVLPSDAIASERSGVGGFAARYGFREKPMRIRCRVLDPRLSPIGGAALPDLTLDVESFAAWEVGARRVFITENETNFLVFPQVEDGLVIFGAGYGWEALGHVAWLARSAVYYWGDLDTHGFAILDQLRRALPQASSLLMDRETLLAHVPAWGEEAEPVRHDLSCLTDAEREVYDDLRYHRLRPNLRLEQERVGYGWWTDRLRQLVQR